MYIVGEKYSGTISFVGAVDRLGGKPAIRVTVEGSHGALDGVVWINPDDAKPSVNGAPAQPSSLERARSLFAYLGCKGAEFNPSRGFAGAVPSSDKRRPVEFTYDERESGGKTYGQAKFIQQPRAAVAFNAPSQAQLDMLFGASTIASAEPVSAPATAHAPSTAADGDIPF